MTNLPHLDDGTTELADVGGALPAARAWAAKLAKMAPSMVVVACVVLFAYRWAVLEVDFLRGLLVDDAYISARHAQNFVDGHGLNFNPDERIEGYTNFLFTLLLAVPQYFGFGFEPFVRALGALTAFGVVVLTATIARSIAGGVIAGILALALVVDSRFVFFSLWGLETIFTCLPYMLGLYWMFQRKYAPASFALAAALLTRMDMALIVGPVALFGLFAAWKEREETPLKKSLRAILLPVCGTFGLYFVLRWGYYGWLLPNTFYAKVGSPSDAWQRGAAYIQECLSAMGIAGLVYASMAAWVLCIAGAIVLRRSLSEDAKLAFARALTVFGCAAGYMAFTIMVGGDHFQERFVYHAIPVLLIACVAPWWLITSRIGETFSGGKRLQLIAILIAAVFMLSLGRAPHRFGSSDSLAAWVSLGRYLKERSPAGAVLATDAAGALPYFSGLRTLDILGLANTTIAHRAVPKLGSGVAGHEKADPQFIVDQRPDYIATWIDPDGGAGRGLSKLRAFDDQYRLAAVVRTDQPNVSAERILSFANEPSPAELIALSKGTGKVPGHYNWGLYVRRQDRDFRMMRNNDFRSNLPGWQQSPERIVHAPRGHVPAHIMYGPFVKFSPGQHVGYVRIKTGPAEDLDPRQRLCGFDVFNGERTINELPISVGEARGSTAEFPFSFEVTAEESTKPYEFRLYCWGLADVTVESVHVK